MHSAFPRGRQPLSAADIDRLLSRPLPDYQPMAADPGLDLSHAPVEGGLAWSLAFGLSIGVVRQDWAHHPLTSGGPVGTDAGLRQAWEHERHYDGQDRLLARQDRCFAPIPQPEPEWTSGPVAAPETETETKRPSEPGLGAAARPALTPLERMLTQLTHAAVAGFLHNLEQGPHAPASGPSEPSPVQRKCAAICHLMDLPWGRKPWQCAADFHPRDTPGWSTRAVFQATPHEVCESLRQAAGSTLDMVRRYPPRDVSPEDLERGTTGFEFYIAGCLGRIDAMAREP